MFKIFSKIVLILLSNFIFGQNDTLKNGFIFSNGLTITDSIQMGLVKFDFNSKKTINNKINDVAETKLSIYIPILPLIDLFSGLSYRLGSEFKVFHNISIYGEGGTFIYKQPNGSWLNKVNGGVGKLGLKFYLNKNKLTSGNQ